ncbi:hypothetical protein GQ44DRAFT_678143 [Phaeosphaeriaceae sp. PMI808]|nr:hypothetical protein GQ44DRAFT_678143 [Phaeosphaeriaceae sp. PMI808]
MSAGAPTVHEGEGIDEYQTDHLGFRALAQGAEGAKKLQVVKPWPTDSLPPASATLLSVSSKAGLLAAAGPDKLIVASTKKVRNAFSEKAGEWDVIADFTPDVTIPLGNPPLRHVVFAADGEFLVVSAEGQGGLAVFDVAKLMQGHKAPDRQIKTDDVAVRMLQVNPASAMDHFMALVLDTGKLWTVDITTGDTKPLRDSGVTCVAWSNKGKAVAVGLQNGAMEIYKSSGELLATIPRPPKLDDNYEVTGVTWLGNTEFLLVHGPKNGASTEDTDNKYHLVSCDKAYTNFEFHPDMWDPLLASPGAPTRALPARFSATRLQNWQPDLDEMLIITTSHTDTIGVLTSSKQPLSAEQKDAAYKKWVLTPAEDTRQAAVPRLVFGEDGDSVLVGEALDLSATEKILRPVPTLEEIDEAPWPLPAYFILTHQGILMAWWVVWNKSIESGTCYPGMIHGSDQQKTEQQPATAPSPAPPKNTQPTPAFGQPSTPSTLPSTGTGLFAKPAATFGGSSNPTFGAPSFGSTSPFPSKPGQPFGSMATPKPAAPAFGSPSVIGGAQASGFGGSGFGATGGPANKASPWGTPSQTKPTTQTQASPFGAAGGGSSGFGKIGQSSETSSFSSFGSTSGTQSGFASFGQQQQKPTFPGLKTEPSGSTITIGSSIESSLPSWANTPSQQGGSIFGQNKSSFNTASFESKSSDMSGSDDRKRDEATPTPQAPPQGPQGLFGLAGGFKLGTTFGTDGIAKDDPAKPAAPSTGSFFGSDFASGLGGSGLKPPATPAKEVGKGFTQNISTTPASPPRQQKSLFQSESATPKAPPPAAAPRKVEDAPLPPDFITTKAPKPADDDLPPLAGSPGVKVEAPSSSVEGSPIDNEDGDEGSEFSVEEEEEDEESGEEVEEVQEPSPSELSRRPPPKVGGWNFQDSVNQSPHVFPPAPTPPAVRTGNVGRSTSPTKSLFGQVPKPAQSTPLFGQQTQKASFPLGLVNVADQSSNPGKPYFPPPTNRARESLRSPSPVRSASTSALRTRQPFAPPGSSLSASVQQAKPPTPQPQVSDLEDEEDERMREQLARKIEPSRTLDAFVSYHEVALQAPNKIGIAAQIEILYKDINGMLDVLGWNARSLKSYIEYHKQPQPGHKIDRQALEDIQDQGQDRSWAEQWTIGEIEGLTSLEAELERELDAGRVQDVLGKLSQLGRLLHEKAKLMTRLNDIRRQIINRKDPDKVESSRKAPLPKEMADKQKDLRSEYARLLTQLSQAEEAVFLLRSRIASHNAHNGKTAAVPTVDAVKKTIVKMTALAEKRNSEITLIEAQMRKLGLNEPSRPSSPSTRILGTPRRSRGTSLRNSIAESPFTTPPTNRNKMSLTELNRRALTPDVDSTPTANKGYGLFYTPDGSPSATTKLSHLSDRVDENIDNLCAAARRRRQVAADLKKALIARGVKTTKIN